MNAPIDQKPSRKRDPSQCDDTRLSVTLIKFYGIRHNYSCFTDHECWLGLINRRAGERHTCVLLRAFGTSRRGVQEIDAGAEWVVAGTSTEVFRGHADHQRTSWCWKSVMAEEGGKLRICEDG
jgi:hypothetical protein